MIIFKNCWLTYYIVNNKSKMTQLMFYMLYSNHKEIMQMSHWLVTYQLLKVNQSYVWLDTKTWKYCHGNEAKPQRALGKVQGAVIKCLEIISSRYELENVNSILWQQLSLVATVMHVATHLMHRYRQKGDCLQGYNFDFTEIIPADSHHKPKDITDLLKCICMYRNYLIQLLAPKLLEMHIQHCRRPLTMHGKSKGMPPHGRNRANWIWCSYGKWCKCQ